MNVEAAPQHNISILDRKKAEISGILEVGSFEDTAIELTCDFGTLSIEGEGLKIDSFSAETGRITVSGTVNALFYWEKKQQNKGGLFTRRSR